MTTLESRLREALRRVFKVNPPVEFDGETQIVEGILPVLAASETTALPTTTARNELGEIENILREVCKILNVKLGPGLATWAPLIARVRELVHEEHQPAAPRLTEEQVRGAYVGVLGPDLALHGKYWAKITAALNAHLSAPREPKESVGE